MAVALYAGIIRRSRDLIGEMYPGSEFSLLVWDLGEYGTSKRYRERAVDQLEKSAIDYHLASDIITDFDEEKYLFRDDRHPMRGLTMRWRNIFPDW